MNKRSLNIHEIKKFGNAIVYHNLINCLSTGCLLDDGLGLTPLDVKEVTAHIDRIANKYKNESSCHGTLQDILASIKSERE